MTTEQLKNWIKTQDVAFNGRIRLGGVDGNATHFLGVYPGNQSGPAHIAIGGPSCTTYDTMTARLLLRWGKSQPEAERKARSLWGLFFGRAAFDMDGAWIFYADPGAEPVSMGRSADGVFEFVINLTITYKKE